MRSWLVWWKRRAPVVTGGSAWKTGTAASFAAANALYERFGFVDGPVFGGYPPSPHNRFMTLSL